jgi:CRISPR-associated endonuclease/helicase Cas3
VLPVRHQFVRLWGLANRVVVFDEIHAYDTYTGTLLLHLLGWLMSLGSSVILLSATLPPSLRRKLGQIMGADQLPHEVAYPRVSVFQPNRIQQIGFPPDPARTRALVLKALAPDIAAMKAAMDAELAPGGFGLLLVNTVDRAQALYRLYPPGEALLRDGIGVGKRLADGTEVQLFHARFPADQRQAKEETALASFGPKSPREGRKILIATQVAEQSLDLDFDAMVTDLAPIDLLLQRAGRLWRHPRASRPQPAPSLAVAGLAGSTPPSFGTPLWWGAVYREDLLLTTWILLHDRTVLQLPDDIDPMVQAVYEGTVDIPEKLEARMERATIEAEGKTFAHRTQAMQTVIGSPDDGSWNDPARFTQADEDEPGLHASLVAHTRLGEPSITMIPLHPADAFVREAVPDPATARAWYLRGISVARPGLVARFQAAGIPPGWAKSPLLRQAYPMLLDASGTSLLAPDVVLSNDLGLVFTTKEPA